MLARVFDVFDFGCHDGAVCTDALRRAALAASGGGTVLVRGRVFTAPVNLTAHVHLQAAAAARPHRATQSSLWQSLALSLRRDAQ